MTDAKVTKSISRDNGSVNHISGREDVLLQEIIRFIQNDKIRGNSLSF